MVDIRPCLCCILDMTKVCTMSWYQMAHNGTHVRIMCSYFHKEALFKDGCRLSHQAVKFGESRRISSCIRGHSLAWMWRVCMITVLFRRKRSTFLHKIFNGHPCRCQVSSNFVEKTSCEANIVLCSHQAPVACGEPCMWKIYYVSENLLDGHIKSVFYRETTEHYCLQNQRSVTIQ